METVFFVIGLGLGLLMAYVVLHIQEKELRRTLREEIAEIYAAKGEAERARIAQSYENRIRRLEAQRETEIAEARKESVRQSRAVLKGKMAEQIAPLLPGFAYWPADARFLGDPIDYVIFNGYSASQDGEGEIDDLEIVIIDIKKGRAALSAGQMKIARAIEAGRVRFEVVRVYDDGQIESNTWGPK
jgi:predicted Holliday junction resolvase-like endonuclease